MGVIEATKLFLSNKTEGLIFTKIVSVFGLTTLPITVFDEGLDFIPGINIISVGDNLLWPFAIYAAIRIGMIRHKANRQLTNPQAIPVSRR